MRTPTIPASLLSAALVNGTCLAWGNVATQPALNGAALTFLSIDPEGLTLGVQFPEEDLRCYAMSAAIDEGHNKANVRLTRTAGGGDTSDAVDVAFSTLLNEALGTALRPVFAQAKELGEQASAMLGEVANEAVSSKGRTLH